MDARSSASRILGNHAEDQVPDLSESLFPPPRFLTVEIKLQYERRPFYPNAPESPTLQLPGNNSEKLPPGGPTSGEQAPRIVCRTPGAWASDVCPARRVVDGAPNSPSASSGANERCEQRSLNHRQNNGSHTGSEPFRMKIVSHHRKQASCVCNRRRFPGQNRVNGDQES